MDYFETPSLFGCPAEILELSRIIDNVTVPKNAADAKTLYITLIQFQGIEKLKKFDVYVMNYLFRSVLTCSGVAQ